MKCNTVKYLAKGSLILLLLVASLSAFAQSRFELAVRGGASTLMYQSDFGKLLPSYNFGADLLYSYRSEHVIGFRGGVAVDFSQSKFHAVNYEDSYAAIDYQNDPYQVSYKIADLTESHNQLYVSVPLQLALHAGNFAIFMGPKIAFPLKAFYRQELTNVEMDVFYPNYGVHVNGDEWVYMGTDRKPYYDYKGDIANTPTLSKMTNINIFASVDINYYVPISKTSSIGIGLYCDYGLPLYKHSPKFNEAAPYHNSVLWINDPALNNQPMTREHTSVLDAFNIQSTEMQETFQSAVVKKINYLTAGIRLSFNIGGERKQVFKHQYKDTRVCRCVFTN